MKRLLVTLALFAAQVAALASAQPVAPSVDRAVETCLRANAARVSAAASSLTDAADFLLTNVCAVEVSTAAARTQREHFERMRARMCENNRPTTEALQSDPGDDVDTAAYLNAYCAGENNWMSESVTVLSNNATASPSERALAGQLVLEARSRR